MLHPPRQLVIRLFAAAAAVALVALLPGAVSARPVGRPLDWGTKAKSSHAPYAQGRCLDCHDNKGPNPGPPTDPSDDGCLATCHAEVTKHAHGFRHCTRCHNAHDSVQPKLLRADINNCESCHVG